MLASKSFSKVPVAVHFISSRMRLGLIQILCLSPSHQAGALLSEADLLNASNFCAPQEEDTKGKAHP